MKKLLLLTLLTTGCVSPVNETEKQTSYGFHSGVVMIDGHKYAYARAGSQQGGVSLVHAESCNCKGAR